MTGKVGILSSEVLLSLTETSLQKVVSDLRSQLATSQEERRARRTTRPATCPRRPVQSVPPPIEIRPATEGPSRIRIPVELHLDPSRDLFVSTRSALSNATCCQGLVRPRTSLKGLGCRGTHSVAERLNLKVKHTSVHLRDKKRAKEDLNGGELKVLVADLRAKNHEIKVMEERMIRELNYNPKQVLTDFSQFGVKVRNGRRKEPKPHTDSTKQLSSLIDSIDAQLSTNEALAAFKQMGMEYHPRTAAGRKNAMATGLSAALAPNGLKLLTAQEESHEEIDDE